MPFFVYPSNNLLASVHPAGSNMFQVNNRKTRTRYEICSKFTPCSSISIVNFEQVLHFVFYVAMARKIFKPNQLLLNLRKLKFPFSVLSLRSSPSKVIGHGTLTVTRFWKVPNNVSLYRSGVHRCSTEQLSFTLM